MKAPLPADEPARLAALHDAQVLDTAPEEDFDDIALLAAEICGTPMGLVSLVDENRQWFKAKVGLGLAEAPRDLSFCSYTINGREVLEVPDAADDERFADNPFVSSPKHPLRFYAGAPVVLDGTYAVGTVCVVDHVPRELTEAQRRALRSLARHAAVQLELRRYARHSAEIADRLRQLDRMKDSFLATVSHELRTPLSTIRGYLEMLMEGEAEGETARRFLGVMQRNSDRLLRLIDELLQVARQADGMDLELAEVDLTEVAHRVTSACQALATHCEVELHDRTDGLALARADSKRLSQALNHLVVNALKFTPPGGVITVESAGDGVPELIIADTGVGIAEEDLPHVFDRFYRCATAEVMAVQGPGLGLAIVKSIVDAHHGSITLESEFGVGTRARLTLPKV